jgi:hypothetical protein
MMNLYSMLIVTLSSTLAYADMQSVISTSPDKAFELIEEHHLKEDYKSYTLREVESKKEVVYEDDPTNYAGDDFLNSGFGSPQIAWCPTNSRLLILAAKLYRDRGTEYAVFQITNNLKLLRVNIPGDSIPDRWNPDGTLVILVRQEATFSFDSAKNAFVPRGSKKLGK